ncbi:copia protein, partial [Trifolium medium]|nr:copia protein [Trifolium medium]
MKDLGPLSYFLVIAVSRHPSGIFLSQSIYASEIIDRAGMASYKSSATLVDTKHQTLHIWLLCFLGDDLISWYSKRQPTLSRSSAEAEHRGVANVVSESCWIRNLLLELHFPIPQATLVYCDNVSVIYLSDNPVQHQRTKHIEMDIYFAREQVARGQACVLHIPSRHQIADIFTKGLPRILFD